MLSSYLITSFSVIVAYGVLSIAAGLVGFQVGIQWPRPNVLCFSGYRQDFIGWPACNLIGFNISFALLDILFLVWSISILDEYGPPIFLGTMLLMVVALGINCSTAGFLVLRRLRFGVTEAELQADMEAEQQLYASLLSSAKGAD